MRHSQCRNIKHRIVKKLRSCRTALKATVCLCYAGQDTDGELGVMKSVALVYTIVSMSYSCRYAAVALIKYSFIISSRRSVLRRMLTRRKDVATFSCRVAARRYSAARARPAVHFWWLSTYSDETCSTAVKWRAAAAGRARYAGPHRLAQPCAWK